MATESRTITFTDVEIVQAITSYCVKTGRITPPVRITAPLVTNEGEVKFSFDPVPAGARITLGENEVLSAIILFCNEHGIPIARRSTKSIQIARDTFSLHLTTPR
ncbi:MAG TPA: hypothetical protein VJN67_08050 [Stellaceae bacterium]|nr:hypothetical protein [Stellaceae bacterium]